MSEVEARCLDAAREPFGKAVELTADLGEMRLEEARA